MKWSPFAPPQWETFTPPLTLTVRSSLIFLELLIETVRLREKSYASSKESFHSS